jgi:hypothetical protein
MIANVRNTQDRKVTPSLITIGLANAAVGGLSATKEVATRAKVEIFWKRWAIDRVNLFKTIILINSPLFVVI